MHSQITKGRQRSIDQAITMSDWNNNNNNNNKNNNSRSTSENPQISQQRYPESSYSIHDPQPQPLANYPIDEYSEPLVSSVDYLKNISKNPKSRSISYVKSLFPIFSWIGHYPFEPKWITSDFITGISVAIVLVPQALSYATLASLPPQYGLYSSFIGLMIYAIFATSKDVSIGPVAVMSLEVSKIIQRVQEKYPNLYSSPEIATTVALLCGAICLGVGLLRLGFLVELIPLPAVMAFTTGSAFSIIASQLPGLMGYNSKVNNHDAAYKIIINSLKHLPDTKKDAAFGLVGLFILYIWKFIGNWLLKRYPKYKLSINYFLNLRTAIVIIFSTLISFCIVRANGKENFKIYSLTGEITPGLGEVKPFKPPANLASAIASDLPVATIVLVLEHISIAKSFGRIHDYKIDANQEFIAIGVSNLIGTFFNAYPATGSFSRTALSAKCGVKTPFASVFAGACVLLAIYCFTSAFYYIPKATLCAIIIHAVSDLLASYKSTWKLYLIQPLDFIIFLVGVFIAVFASIEDGIYWAMCASAALIIWRMCFTNGNFMGRIRVVEIINPIIKNNEQTFNNSGLVSLPDSMISTNKAGICNEYAQSVSIKSVACHYRWIPMPNNKLLPDLNVNHSSIHTRYINPSINIESPPPGVVVYRLGESFIYPNSSHECDRIVNFVKRTTKSSSEILNVEKKWNNPGQLNVSFDKFSILKFWQKSAKSKSKSKSKSASPSSESIDLESQLSSTSYSTSKDIDIPTLRIIHLDFSQVTAIDTTSIQALIDMHQTLENYSGKNFQIHFSGIINPWVIRGLVNAGFGGKVGEKELDIEVDLEEEKFRKETNENNSEPYKIEKVNWFVDAAISDNSVLPLFGTDLPNFHFDIPSYENL
ncbi:sulfate permease [Martiniozyma asiatica (nom. inval.)]|nr:sulfate permease [Martiniozyma asiatica]